MAGAMYRIGIVGASSLMGKELVDVLSDSSLAASDLVLLDDEALTGTMTSAGDEAAFIQKLDASSFDGMDFVFFCGSQAIAKAHWQVAHKAGVSIVDLTYALEGMKDVQIWAPWVEEAIESCKRTPDIRVPAVVVAHPASVMMGMIAARLKGLGIEKMAATIMEPASEYGIAAMDELQQQTVNLLSFQALPKEQYDAQVTFNLLPGTGEAAKIDFAATERRILSQYERLSGGNLAELALQLVLAPVFHGYTASVIVDLSEPTTVLDVEGSLMGVHVDVVASAGDPPSNLSAAGQENILMRVRAGNSANTRLVLWVAADNLKQHALHAVACALEMKKARPSGKLQH
jgi:aspartate-semialdehyde dehydrogenase